MQNRPLKDAWLLGPCPPLASTLTPPASPCLLALQGSPRSLVLLQWEPHLPSWAGETERALEEQRSGKGTAVCFSPWACCLISLSYFLFVFSHFHVVIPFFGIEANSIICFGIPTPLELLSLFWRPSRVSSPRGVLLVLSPGMRVQGQRSNTFRAQGNVFISFKIRRESDF